MKEHSFLFFVIIVIICQQQHGTTQLEKLDNVKRKVDIVKREVDNVERKIDNVKRNVKCKVQNCDDVDIDYDYHDTLEASQTMGGNFPADFDFLPVSHNANKEPKSERTNVEGFQYPFLVRIGIRNESYKMMTLWILNDI